MSSNPRLAGEDSEVWRDEPPPSSIFSSSSLGRGTMYRPGRLSEGVMVKKGRGSGSVLELPEVADTECPLLSTKQIASSSRP